MFRSNKINHEKNNLNLDNLRGNHEEYIKNYKLISKSHQSLRSEKHNVFTEEVNNIANDDKRIQSIDSIKTYAYGKNKEIIYRRKKNKCNNTIKQYQK